VVDPHCYRSHSYASIDWVWVRYALARAKALMSRLNLVEILLFQRKPTQYLGGELQ